MLNKFYLNFKVHFISISKFCITSGKTYDFLIKSDVRLNKKSYVIMFEKAF